MLANAQALARGLEATGVRLVSGGTDTGMLLLDLRPKKLTGTMAVESLERAGLTCNKNLIPSDPEPAEVCSGLRLSTNAGTTRGFGVDEFDQIAHWIAQVLDGLTIVPDGMAEREQAIHAQVCDLCARFPIY